MSVTTTLAFFPSYFARCNAWNCMEGAEGKTGRDRREKSSFDSRWRGQARGNRLSTVQTAILLPLSRACRRHPCFPPPLSLYFLVHPLLPPPLISHYCQLCRFYFATLVSSLSRIVLLLLPRTILTSFLRSFFSATLSFLSVYLFSLPPLPPPLSHSLSLSSSLFLA